MKCPSVTGLWPVAPPSHRATCASAFPDTAAIYTGGSDGSIVWWSLAGREIRPMALLCGHAAPVVALLGLGSVPGKDSVLVSACVDGVLCVWAAASGRCRRRRKLPPWAGTPVVLSPLPSSPGHACLVCVSSDSRGQYLNVGRKYTVLIIDSWSLNIQKTVFHGGLPIGSLKAMIALPAQDNEEKRGQDLILVDNHGKVQYLTVPEGDQDAKVAFQQESSSSDVLPSSEKSNDEQLQAVAITHDGKLLAMVSGSRCILRSVEDNVAIGEIKFSGTSTYNESSEMKSQLSGVVFLEKDTEKDGSRANNFSTGFIRRLVLWSSNGSAALYNLSSGSSTFKSELMFDVPSSRAMLEGEGSVCFFHSKSSLVRIESLCYKVGGSLLWKPYVTLWSTEQSGSITGNDSGSPYLNRLLGEGGFSGDSVDSRASSRIYETQQSTWKSIQQDDDCYTNGLLPHDRTVSSSMILYGDMYAPTGVVYGFYNGQIEVLQFMSTRPPENSDSDSVNHQIYPKISDLIFSGHTGAVLCLAAKNLVVKSETLSFHQVLISGSMDCTIRIWDLDTCSLHSVLHHHVAPVRQIILPSPETYLPWSHCFLSVGDDCCVSLVSLETLRVERMFPGHPSYPSMVAWDGIKGYIACLCRNVPLSSDSSSILYFWDVKAGARERIIHGHASQSMFDNFCSGISRSSINVGIISGSTSASSLLPFLKDDVKMIEKRSSVISMVDKSHRRMTSFDNTEGQSNRGKAPLLDAHDLTHNSGGNTPARQDKAYKFGQNKKHPVKCYCPFPGIAALKFGLSSLMSPLSLHGNDRQAISHANHHEVVDHSLELEASASYLQGTESRSVKESLEGYLLRFSLCFLHLWGIDPDLDKLLMDEMKVSKPEGCHIASGVLGDRGTLTIMFPSFQSTLELWKSSSEFCAMRSLAIVSLAQRMINISQSCTTASSALAAFYTRKFAEKFPDIKPPSLQLLVSFWQDQSEHIRMAARSLFHCAAPRAIPYPFCLQKARTPQVVSSFSSMEKSLSPSTESELISSPFETDRCTKLVSIEDETSSIVTWLESFEFQEWTLWVGRTSQDAMAANVIVASALVVWYPSLVKNTLPKLVLNHLIKLVKSTNDRYSSTAAELLAEGMETTWKDCLGSEFPHLLNDIFFQIECLIGAPANKGIYDPAVSVTIREALVEILLPSLAMADIVGFLSVIESQIWATSSDSPVHLVSLKTLIRVARGSLKPLAPHLDKAINYVLQTMDPGNLVMRKACLNSSMIVLREFVRVYPMVAFNQTSTRLAVGDAVGDIHTASIRVYDMQSVTKVKILDARGPPGLPVLLEGSSKVTTTITALAFSPDGEGLVAFSENGLMIRWWSLGAAWWEKLSRNLVPVPCTKLILVPPWEGFSPNSSRSSIMACAIKQDEWVNSKNKTEKLDDADQLKLLIHNLDLSYRLEWVDAKNIKLTHYGQDMGIFQM